MTTQSEALRLAHELDNEFMSIAHRLPAAAELRRLDAENARFRFALDRIAHWGGTTKYTGSGSYTDVARTALGEQQ